MNAAVLRIDDFDDDFDPFTALLIAGNEAHVVDPYGEYERLLRTGGPVQKLDLRAQMGVHPDLTLAGMETYAVMGFDAVTEILLNPTAFTNEIYKKNLGITCYHGFSNILAALFTHPDQLDAISTSSARRSATWPSAMGRTSASASTSREWSCRSRSTPFWIGCPASASIRPLRRRRCRAIRCAAPTPSMSAGTEAEP